ncbi:PEGA domain-containing protein [Methanohalophilus sp.]
MLLALLLVVTVVYTPSLAEASQETGNIKVITKPSGFDVYLDGNFKGTTPTTINNIQSGTYIFSIPSQQKKSLTYKSITEIISVDPSSTYTLEIYKEMDIKRGDVVFTSEPSDAKIYIDGKFKGNTPLKIDGFPVGYYKVRLEKLGYTTSLTTEKIDDDENNINKELEVSIFTYLVPFIFLFIIGIVKIKRKTKLKTTPNFKSSNNDSIVISTDNADYFEKENSIVENENTQNTNRTTYPFDENFKNYQLESALENIYTKSAFNYKGASITYKVKIENQTSEPIGDIKISVFVPDVFLLSESVKAISLLKPNESKTVTFDIRPTGECGDCEVSGKITYYDYSTKKTTEKDIEPKNLSIVCPILHSKTITEDRWRNLLTNFSKAEETTKELDIPASTMFDVASDVLQDMNLFMLDPKVNDSDNLYRAVAKFYGEGVKDLKYAAQIEIVGGSKKSKLILKAWSEKEEALTGFYHGILDELEKRVNVKGLIENNIVNHYHYGDNIGTQITDSLVQRSNIGISNSDDKEDAENLK